MVPVHAQDGGILGSLINKSFTGTYGQRTTQTGENLQRLAEAGLGNQLVWPLVWWPNRELIPDPELFETGLTLKVPRLKAGFDNSDTFQALEVAYIQVYQRYRSIPIRTVAQRRWVLQQAASAGINPLGPSWDGLLDTNDYEWAKTKLSIAKITVGSVESESLGPGINTPGNSTDSVSRTLGSATTLYRSKNERDVFFKKIKNGTPLPLVEMEGWISAINQAGESELYLQELELLLVKEDTPPQVAFTISLQYRRLGMIGKEYAALEQTEQALIKRPDVVFNVLLLNGRKKMIEADVQFSEIMTSSLTVTAKPGSAIISVNGQVWGSGTQLRTMLPPDTYLIQIQDSKSKTVEKVITLKAGEKLVEEFELETKEVATVEITSKEPPKEDITTKMVWRITLGPKYSYYLDSNNWASNDSLIGMGSFMAEVFWKFLDNHGLLLGYSYGGHLGNYKVIKEMIGITPTDSVPYKVQSLHNTAIVYTFGYGYEIALGNLLSLRPELIYHHIYDEPISSFTNTASNTVGGEILNFHTGNSIGTGLILTIFPESSINVTAGIRYHYVFDDIPSTHNFTYTIPGSVDQIKLDFDYDLDTFDIIFGIGLSF